MDTPPYGVKYETPVRSWIYTDLYGFCNQQRYSNWRGVNRFVSQRGSAPIAQTHDRSLTKKRLITHCVTNQWVKITHACRYTIQVYKYVYIYNIYINIHNYTYIIYLHCILTFFSNSSCHSLHHIMTSWLQFPFASSSSLEPSKISTFCQEFGAGWSLRPLEGYMILCEFHWFIGK